MRIYFLSCVPAALKLDGAYLGIIDGFERFVDLGEGKRVFAEAVPANGLLAASFFIDEQFFRSPPEFADVYLTDGDAVVYLSRYEQKPRRLKVIAQKNLNGLLVTLFCEGGGVYVATDGISCNLYDLPAPFEKATLSERTVGGLPVIAVEGDGCLAIISADGKRVFMNPAESWEFGDRLKVTVNFNTCAGCKAVCEFAYDGAAFTAVKSETRQYMPPKPEVMHFAFFESVLTRCDFSSYLCDELKARAKDVPTFLGEFVDVTIPYSRVYERHGDIRAAGLVYPISENLFKIKYFAVDVTDGKITNIYEVE